MIEDARGILNNPIAPEAAIVELRRIAFEREQLRLRMRYVMRELRIRGWPGKWPRAMLITHKGWE